MNTSEREVLKVQLMDFIKRVSGAELELKTPEEVQILPGILELFFQKFGL